MMMTPSKMNVLIMLLALCFTGCAGNSIPEEKPYYSCMLMYGNKFKCYPRVNQGMREIEKKTTDVEMIGSMCLRPIDFEIREAYIMELEERLKSK
jgi:hypothetical protein